MLTGFGQATEKDKNKSLVERVEQHARTYGEIDGRHGPVVRVRLDSKPMNVRFRFRLRCAYFNVNEILVPLYSSLTYISFKFQCSTLH